ncbi:MAG: methionine adenosyltransferase, partial [Acidobacteria bacterium]|nr:methionine adenosyltransferase [Acidobacteriota bacterium]
IVDSYGGTGRHGGGAFSGKDPSKVDRSAAYMGRYVAKNVVAAGLADKCEVQFAYAIGFPEPVSVLVETFGTGQVPHEAIEKAVLEIFSFKPANIIKLLNLLRPIHSKTTNYGHFGKTGDLDTATLDAFIQASADREARGSTPHYEVGWNDCRSYTIEGLSRAGVGSYAARLQVLCSELL